MSFSNPDTGLLRPTRLYLKFNRGHDAVKPGPLEGKYSAWNRDKQKEEEISIDGAIVLDAALISVTGYVKNHPNRPEGYVWSNEVRAFTEKTSHIVVRYSKTKQVYAEGTYSEFKEAGDVGGNGRPAHTRCAYLLLADGRIAHMENAGSAGAAWSSFFDTNKAKLTKHSIKLAGRERKKNGKVYYWVPQFELGPEINAVDIEHATEADKQVQEYLKVYLKSDHTQDPEYDRDEMNTDNWAAVECPDGLGTLGELDLAGLQELETELDNAGEHDGTLYQFVCRGIKHHQELARKEAGDPDPQDVFGGGTQEEEPAEDVINWREIVRDGKGNTLDGLTLEQLEQGLAYYEKNPDKALPNLIIGLKAGIAELTAPEETSQGDDPFSDGEDEDDLPF